MKGMPITLWKDGNSVRVFPIDAPAWREDGWSEDPSNTSPAPVDEVEDTVDSGSEDESVPEAPAPAKKAKG